MNDSFDIQEEFLGLYQAPTTTGKSLCGVINDVMIRLQLPVENLRAQTYGGASNMSGKFHGCQVEMKKLQPLTLYTYYGTHVTHLV